MIAFSRLRYPVKPRVITSSSSSGPLVRPCSGWQPVPIEKTRSGWGFSGQSSALSADATHTGLLCRSAPSMKIRPDALWWNGLKYRGAADVARALYGQEISETVVTIDVGGRRTLPRLPFPHFSFPPAGIRNTCGRQYLTPISTWTLEKRGLSDVSTRHGRPRIAIVVCNNQRIQ